MFWLLYNLFAVFNGVSDALLYAGQAAESFDWNEHRVLVWLRAAAIAVALGAAGDALLCAASWEYTFAWLAWEVGSIVLSFSLFHNEAYNFTRVWINSKESFSQAWAVFKFNYQSSTTTARFDFDGRTRWWLAAGGGVWFAVGVLLFTKII